MTNRTLFANIKAVIYMFYENENPIIEITAVENIKWDEEYFEVKARDYSALSFRIAGQGQITYENKNCFVNTNDILYLPQNIPYCAEYTDTEIIVIHFKTLYNDKNVESYHIPNTERVYKLFVKALQIWQSKKIGYKVFITAVLYEILGTILTENNRNTMPEYFLKAISIINSEYKNTSLSIKTVCERVGVSETVFRKLFSENYKKPPLAYITELRLEYARNLIANGSTIENAAYESGFSDPKYFARVVKKHLGCTPSALKNYGK